MKRFTFLAILSVVLALLLTSLLFAAPTQQISTVQADVPALMVPVSPASIEQIVAIFNNATFVNAASPHPADFGAVVASLVNDDAVKRNVTAVSFSQVVAASPPMMFGNSFSSYAITAMTRKSAVVEYISPTAISQVKILKNPTMTAQFQGEKYSGSGTGSMVLT